MLALPGHTSEQGTDNKPKTRLDRKCPIQVRIHLPPAESRLRTRLLQRRARGFFPRPAQRVHDSNAAPHSDDVRTSSTAVDAEGQNEHVSRGAAASRNEVAARELPTNGEIGPSRGRVCGLPIGDESDRNGAEQWLVVAIEHLFDRLRGAAARSINLADACMPASTAAEYSC
jgi:hypothetical protein